MSEIKYQIIQKIGVLSSRAEGSASDWAKELNLTSWNAIGMRSTVSVTGPKITKKWARA